MYPATTAIAWVFRCPRDSPRHAERFIREPWALVLPELQHGPSTVLEPSMHCVTRSSHSILSGRVCYLCFTGEETKASRGRELHLGSCLKYYTSSIPFFLPPP